MNPYEWAFTNPELLLLHAAGLALLAAWMIWSLRKLFRWGVSIHKSYPHRWNGIIPPDDIAREITSSLIVFAAWCVLTGGLVHVVT